MRRPSSTMYIAALAALGVVVLLGGSLRAQQPAPTSAPATAPAPDSKLADQWRNFVHYIMLAQEKAAESYGSAILAGKPDPKQLYLLWITTDRSGTILARARRVNQTMADIVDQLSAIINQGALASRTDAAEIARWVEMLSGGPREFQNGSSRLTHAGEYAVPLMVNKLDDDATSRMVRARLVTVLPKLGREAVRPLVEALPNVKAETQIALCRTLGRIGYRHAAPYLKELSEQEGLMAQVRAAADAAVAATAGREAVAKPAAELFYELAVKYYRRHESVGPDARYEKANVWFWKKGLGLTYVAVPRSIFNEVYTMRAARRVLALDPKFYPAVPLWLAANLRKESSLGAGEQDPTHAIDEPGAEFYALAASAEYLQKVLTMALKDRDVAVAMGAIAALDRTAGAENLVRPVAGGAPSLVTALGDPVREIRYMAAEALAKARPRSRFTGDNLVVPVLVQALRQTAAPMVALADPDLQQRNKVKDLLRAAKMEVFDAATSGKAVGLAQDAGGVDLLVLASDIATPGLASAVAELRRDATLSRAPVVIVAKDADLAAAQRLAADDSLTVVLPASKLDAAALTAAIDQARQDPEGSKPLTPEQSVDWAVRAADCMRLLAMMKNPVYDLSGAVASLVAALSDDRDPVRIAAAEALAQFRSAVAQQGIVRLANDAQASKTARLAAYAAASESVRMFGNEATENQVNNVIAVVAAKGDLEIRRAGAQLLGAMALPSEKINELILSAE